MVVCVFIAHLGRVVARIGEAERFDHAVIAVHGRRLARVQPVNVDTGHLWARARAETPNHKYGPRVAKKRNSSHTKIKMVQF